MEPLNVDEYYKSQRSEMIGFVPRDARRILEIGCAAGIFSNSIKSRQKCEVWGMEISEKYGRDAMNLLDKVVIGDVITKLNEIPESYFDCIICNDILEHLVDPFSFLVSLRRYVVPGGKIVCSIPNIRYYRVLKDLVMNGEWKYNDSGVLDITHLRFFTKKAYFACLRSVDGKSSILKELTQHLQEHLRYLTH
ncbi:MAG: class I SAM-dependent methyltransferase [Syntrophaceae bacterium]|nr:class I SAM-dependent methyltransferase [Syntrophaceae bacterium]